MCAAVCFPDVRADHVATLCVQLGITVDELNALIDADLRGMPVDMLGHPVAWDECLCGVPLTVIEALGWTLTDDGYGDYTAVAS